MAAAHLNKTLQGARLVPAVSDLDEFIVDEEQIKILFESEPENIEETSTDDIEGSAMLVYDETIY